MGNALRALVLLACSWSVELLALHNRPGVDAAWFVIPGVTIPFVLAVVVAWRGHDR